MVYGNATVITAGVYSRQLIGRSRELTFLHERARDVSHRAGTMVVRGESGIGKTRLVTDFLRAASEDGLLVAIGTAREYASGPYAALIEALPALGAGPLPPPSTPGDEGKAAWYAATADVLREAVADARRGAVLVLEDLHWADTATIDLLRFCAARLAAVPLLFVATYRTDDVETDSARARALAGLERDADVVTLHPLSPGQIEHLVSLVLDGIGRHVPAEVVAEIRDLSDGRPLFAEELLRGVLERLERDERAEASVPSSVRATVRERYASLGERAREVLLHAAVFGRRFSATTVARLLGVELRVVYGALRQARDLQLVTEERGPDDDHFAFRHALTREAIYGEMLRAEARVVHGRVAALLADEPQPNPAEVADHAWRAHDEAMAAAWNERAGAAAASVYAYGDAARSYERAFRSTMDAVLRARVAEGAAQAWYAMGDLEQSARWYAEAAGASRQAGLGALAGRHRLRRARILFECDRYDEGIAEADSVALEDGISSSLRIEAETIAAGLLLGRGRAPEALERLRSVEPGSHSLDRAASTRFSATYAYALAVTGRASEARSRFAETVALAEAAGDPDMVLRTYNNWGLFELTYGSLPRARELYAIASAIADGLKNRRHTAWLAMNAALSALLGADFDAAERLLTVGAQAEHGGVALVRRWSLAVMLRLKTLRGVEDDALLEQATRSFEDARDAGDVATLPLLGAALAFYFALLRAPDEATRILAAAEYPLERIDVPFWFFDIVSRFGDRDLRRRARLALESISAREGALPAQGHLALMDAREALRKRDREEATRRAEKAVDAFRSAGWRVEEGYALEVAGRVGDAIALFRGAGAAGEVRRLTETASGPRGRGEGALTAREGEIVRLVVAGHTTRTIAEALIISERTVETHIASVYRKLGVASRQQLAALLDEAGTAT